ncbi:MAG: DUF2851 family protein [Chloroflexi bacterium]|nr:DUF2851 family protein [Chloroflexota bacterium]
MVTALREEKEDYSPLPEKTLARLWQKRAALQREFRTGAGRRVRVLYPGRPGTAAGPDFRDAVLEMEGLGVVQGDVELHLRQQDWYAHGHAEDPNYNGVVLHAALETDPRPTNLHNGHQAPVISLSDLLEQAEEAGERDLPAGGPQLSGELWSLLENRGWPRPTDASEAANLLDAAGEARFAGRAEMFAAFCREQPAAQALYEGLMESLGYRNNRQPFLKLARAAPWNSLVKEALGSLPEQRTRVVEAWLLQLSGLDGPEEKIAKPLARYGRPMNAKEWHCFRVRPANHPRHRIAGAARLLTRCTARAEEGEGLVEDGLITFFDNAVNSCKPASLASALTVNASEKKGPAYIGTGRARDMAVNVVLPFFHAWHDGGDTAALDLYRVFPKLQENEVTREMKDRLLLPEWAGLISTAQRQQGLIHLYRQLS